MRLKNNLFFIIGNSISDKEFEFKVRLEKDCTIYKAHFPQNPITPGVCIIQIAKELFEEKNGCQVEIKKMKSVKFLNLMSPSQKKEYIYHFSKFSQEEDTYKMQVEVTDGDVAYSKMSLTCKEI